MGNTWEMFKGKTSWFHILFWRIYPLLHIPLAQSTEIMSKGPYKKK